MPVKATVTIGIESSREAVTVKFLPENGDQFCDTAIELASAIFKALGVKNNGGYVLADFKLTQETYVWLDDAWTSYAQWLRIKHHLPVHTPLA